MKNSFILVIIILFAVLSGAFYLLVQKAPQFNLNLLMGANIIMAALTIAGYAMVRRQLANSPAAFVRGVYGNTFLKLMVCIVSIVGYAMLNKPHVHKPSLFMAFGIYAVYTTIETLMLSKMAKSTK